MANDSNETKPIHRRLIFSKKDWGIMRSLQRQVKKRYVTHVLLVLGLLYCLGLGGLSSYYAILMFMGEEEQMQVVVSNVKFKDFTTSPSAATTAPTSKTAEIKNDSRGGMGALLPKNIPTVEKFVKPIYEKVNFFNIGWTSMLHAILLFYLATRAFLRLRLLKKQTPRAKLAIKMADRLQELGELHDEPKDEQPEK